MATLEHDLARKLVGNVLLILRTFLTTAILLLNLPVLFLQAQSDTPIVLSVAVPDSLRVAFTQAFRLSLSMCPASIPMPSIPIHNTYRPWKAWPVLPM